MYNNTEKIILFTNARDEHNIKEWITHHLLLGFDYIYIFDHKSKNPIEPQIAMFNNDKLRVIVKKCKLSGAIKNTLVAKATIIARYMNADWMLYIDADEFLVINDDKINNVKKLMKLYPYADSVSFNWLFFGTNNHVNTPDGLIVDNYTRSEQKLNNHLKTFVRPNKVVGPCCHMPFTCSNKMYHGNGKRFDKHLCQFNNDIDYFKSKVFFAHYVYQSEETYINRKILLPRDDCGEFRTKIDNLHSQYNDVENNLVRDKYSKNIKIFMKEKDAVQYKPESESTL
jgi:hypothetical protein